MSVLFHSRFTLLEQSQKVGFGRDLVHPKAVWVDYVPTILLCVGGIRKYLKWEKKLNSNILICILTV